MDGLILLIIAQKLWENAMIIIALIGLLGGMAGTVVAAYITWRTDRPRLDKAEINIERMREDLEIHKAENIETFKEIRESIHSSNKEVVKSIDELKMYLLHSKITIKGDEAIQNK